MQKGRILPIIQNLILISTFFPIVLGPARKEGIICDWCLLRETLCVFWLCLDYGSAVICPDYPVRWNILDYKTGQRQECFYQFLFERNLTEHELSGLDLLFRTLQEMILI